MNLLSVPPCATSTEPSMYMCTRAEPWFIALTPNASYRTKVGSAHSPALPSSFHASKARKHSPQTSSAATKSPSSSTCAPY